MYTDECLCMMYVHFLKTIFFGEKLVFRLKQILVMIEYRFTVFLPSLPFLFQASGMGNKMISVYCFINKAKVVGLFSYYLLRSYLCTVHP